MSSNHGPCPVSWHTVTSVAGYDQSTHPCLNKCDHKLDLSMGDARMAATIESYGHSTLHFLVDNSVWEIIHGEIMDWRDPFWTSMGLPENMTCRPYRIFPSGN